MFTCFPSSESGCNPNVFSTIVQRFLTRVFHSRLWLPLFPSSRVFDSKQFGSRWIFPYPSRIFLILFDEYITRWISQLFRASWSRGKGPATSCQEFHFKLVELGNKERQRSMTGRRVLHPFRGWNFYPTINSKEETRTRRGKNWLKKPILENVTMKIVRSSSQECMYICMYKVYIFDCLKTFQWNSWKVYESWIYIDRKISDKTRTRYQQEAISR